MPTSPEGYRFGSGPIHGYGSSAPSPFGTMADSNGKGYGDEEEEDEGMNAEIFASDAPILPDLDQMQREEGFIEWRRMHVSDGAGLKKRTTRTKRRRLRFAEFIRGSPYGAGLKKRTTRTKRRRLRMHASDGGAGLKKRTTRTKRRRLRVTQRSTAKRVPSSNKSNSYCTTESTASLINHTWTPPNRARASSVFIPLASVLKVASTYTQLGAYVQQLRAQKL